MLQNKNVAVLWVLAGVITVKYFHVLCWEVVSDHFAGIGGSVVECLTIQ